MSSVLFKNVLISLDDETIAITKKWHNVSASLRELIIEYNNGLKPLCLECGKKLIMIVGTPILQCSECDCKFQLVKKRV